MLAYMEWDFSFFVWRSDFFVAEEVFVSEARVGEIASEGLRAAVTSAVSVLILFGAWRSDKPDVRLRIFLVGLAGEISSCLTVASCPPSVNDLFGDAVFDLFVTFFFNGRSASLVFAVEARVVPRAMFVIFKS
jgi:hypothetical protein